ncbi:BTB/POZ domain-containing protein [Scenedesmus sp. PABB004]|nr:BTB/POZ domain-containing protein [Scenedesmus sp. PABB004]
MDFAWLWRNEELSDFVLLIRPAPRPAAEGAAAPAPPEEPAAPAGQQRRASKRRRAAESAPGDVQPADGQGATAQAEPAPPGRATRRQQKLQQQQQRERGGAAGEAQPDTQAQQARDQRPAPRGQQAGQQQAGQPQPQPPPPLLQARRSRRGGGAARQDSAAGSQQQQQEQQPPPGGSTRATRGSSRKPRGGEAAADADAPAAAAAAAGEADAGAAPASAAGTGSRGGGRRRGQPAGGAGSSAAAAAAGADACAAAAPAAAGSGEIRLPVHAVVLAAFSPYFKALITGWAGSLGRTLTLDVGPDEGTAAELMLEFMYTGKLPGEAAPEELLRMVRLADQFQVTRLMAAASCSFESLPLASLSIGTVLEVFSLPQVMLEAPEMSRILAKGRAKLLELYGDLDQVWSSEALREEFLRLPEPAVRCLLASEGTAVASENTALVALGGWVEEGAGAAGLTPAQRRELLGLVRLPYLSSSFVGDVLLAVPWVREALDSRALLNAFQFAIASESTRQRLASFESSPSPHFRCPRPLSAVSRASFEWSIELATIKRMVADAKLWGRVVELSSPLHYFAGFWWQLMFNVEKAPSPADAEPPGPDGAAPAGGATVVEFVGVRCHVNVGSHDLWPRIVRFRASIAALQAGFWEADYAYTKGIEGPIVDGVGLGYPGYFALPGQALENEAAWSRFVRQGRVQLRCEVLDCE